MPTDKELRDIENEISKLEKRLIFLENVDSIQTEIMRLSNHFSLGMEYTKDRILQEMNFISVISELELNYLKKYILSAKSLIEKQYLFKLSYLNIYEFSTAYNKKLKDLKNAFPASNDYFEAFKYVSRHIQRIKTKHSFDINIAFIRNKMAAHKELTLTNYSQKNNYLKKKIVYQ